MVQTIERQETKEDFIALVAAASDYRWYHINTPSDIIAYRIHKSAE
jgi:hypothetical protein